MRKYIILGLLFVSSLSARDSYLLTHPSYNPGFFSVFHTVIGALDFVEKERSGLRVDFEDKGHYYEASFGPNWWEYYFEPIDFGNKKHYKRFPVYKKADFSYTAQFAMTKNETHRIITKYIKLKPHVQKKIDSFFEENLAGHEVIGIHYRGTDKYLEAPKVSYDEVYQKIHKAVHPETKIFIATDDANFLAFMKNQFPGQVAAIDAIRSANEKAVHCHMQGNGYKKGEDAIIDCILLSKCQVLYKMASNLSDAALEFNPNIPVIYLNQDNHL